MNCENCKKEHSGSYGSGRFCCRSCSNSRPRSEEIKKKISLSIKNSEKHKIANKKLSDQRKGVLKKIRIKKECEYCGTMFEVLERNKNTKYCGSECRYKCSGGYRKGAARSKVGYYNGIYCESTYELVWVIYQIDHQRPFERFTNKLEYNNEVYFPDFLQFGEIIEIKGFVSEGTFKQIRVGEGCGYKVNLLTKDKLIDEFNWVKQKYNYKKLQELYDDYKPTFEYTCDYCKTVFNTENKRRKATKFCNNICAIKYIRTKHSDNINENITITF